jgi:nicotinate dehydrogenase subunit B
MSITSRKKERAPRHDEDVEIFEGSGLTRSTFLKAGGALVIGISLPMVAETASAEASVSPVKQVPTLTPLSSAGIPVSALSSYLAIAADGKVTAFTGKVDLGQGNQTAISQIIAEELYLTADKITLIMGNTDTTVNQGYTAGSSTIQTMWTSMRPAAAFGYQTLLQMAATKLGVPAANLTAANGIFTDSANPSVTVSYGDLVGGQVFTQTVPTKGTALNVPANMMKPVSQYTVVGTSADRIDIPPKVTGDYEYVQDIRVPGMLHGRVIRPTGIGSQLVTVGPAPKGVKIVRINNFLAVAAEDEWTAIQAAENLKVTWTQWKGLPTMAGLKQYIYNSPEIKGSPALMTSSADASTRSRRRPTGRCLRPRPTLPRLWPAQQRRSRRSTTRR